MRWRLHLSFAPALLAGSLSLHAQEPVVGASDPEALFHSSDPKLNTNKQAAYHIVKDLLEAGDWGLADKYLTEGDPPHNPNAGPGRGGGGREFTKVQKVRPLPKPEKMKKKGGSVGGEGEPLGGGVG